MANGRVDLTYTGVGVRFFYDFNGQTLTRIIILVGDKGLVCDEDGTFIAEINKASLPEIIDAFEATL